MTWVTPERGVHSPYQGAKAPFLSSLHLEPARRPSQHLWHLPRGPGSINNFPRLTQPLFFPRPTAIFDPEGFSPSCGAACPLLLVSFEATSLALILCLGKLGTTSEIEQIAMAISTTRGQKLLTAKCHRGVGGQEKAIYFSQHFIKETSRVTPLTQVTSYISPQ